MGRQRYAVIPTRDRPEDFLDCYRAIATQVDRVFIISHDAEYPKRLPAHDDGLLYDGVVLRYRSFGRLPNISQMWNMGIQAANDYAGRRPHDVAILNDDAIVPLDWFDRISAAMTVSNAVLGSHLQSPTDYRLAGHAFIVRGEWEDRYADEQFQWWGGDTDLQRRAEGFVGGFVTVPGLTVEHRHPNETTVGALAEVAEADRERFKVKWGEYGW